MLLQKMLQRHKYLGEFCYLVTVGLWHFNVTKIQSYEIKLPPRAILGFQILEISLCWKLRQVGCYDVAKFRFVNRRQLWINAQLCIHY